MDANAQDNSLLLVATLVERESLRYTPAGIPMVSAKLRHLSQQREADTNRTVELELAAVFPGRLAQAADRVALGTALRLRGFLAPRRKASKTLVMHVTEFDLSEV